MVTTKLEQAREAQRQIDKREALARELPQLELEYKRQVELETTQAKLEIAEQDLANILQDFERRKATRDKKLDRLLQMFSSVFQDCQNFDKLSRNVMRHAESVAYHKLVLSIGVSNMDNQLVKAHGEQELLDRQVWPLSKFAGDDSQASQAVLQALADFVDLTW